MIKELRFILDNYNEFRLNQYTSTESSLDENIKKLITKVLPEAIQRELIENDNYIYKGSFGQGNYTETPWLAVFDKDLSISAQKGFYVVIAFRKDMKGFYLSLNQGTTYLKNKFKNENPRLKMKHVAKYIGSNITIPQEYGFTQEEVTLVANTDNAKNYAAANICAKYYDKEVNFSKDEFIKDLKQLLVSLEEIKKFIGARTIDETIDDIIYKNEIDDVKFQEDVQFAKPASSTVGSKKRPSKTKAESMKWERDSSIAKEALVNANYLCEIDQRHTTFISKVTKQNYVEAHHLIPMSLQEEFEYSIDVVGNIVSLCPNCHSAIHHAEKNTKKKLIKKLFEDREELLKKYEIWIEFRELFLKYDIKE
ncbi:hypothetical protein AQ616_17815 [Oceanobacillus sp. E9]|uniref:MrcB family domain-containing protein n=1 Tax=Oceanobacillus sp. E9 TaxID=1742575 RepID=UPI00084EC5CA|nr:DUF3578 domain-containing protein [Oceanobacillus sp. E9]OEH53137.1 hypothetical protein AQ616_17815 [Oceanobacillus sp. E9]